MFPPNGAKRIHTRIDLCSGESGAQSAPVRTVSRIRFVLEDPVRGTNASRKTFTREQGRNLSGCERVRTN
jgi:hypothetical protein